MCLNYMSQAAIFFKHHYIFSFNMKIVIKKFLGKIQYNLYKKIKTKDFDSLLLIFSMKISMSFQN